MSHSPLFGKRSAAATGAYTKTQLERDAAKSKEIKAALAKDQVALRKAYAEKQRFETSLREYVDMIEIIGKEIDAHRWWHFSKKPKEPADAVKIMTEFAFAKGQSEAEIDRLEYSIKLYEKTLTLLADK